MDIDTKLLIEILSIIDPMNKLNILNFPATYRTAIDLNLLGLLEGRLVYYESTLTIAKHICHIIVTKSLATRFIM